MADINLLIEPITENNIVNSINITSSQKHFNNFFLDTNFIKSKKYSDNYTTTNNKIGQLKIKKFVNTRLFNTPYSIVSKAVKQKQVISLNTDNDKYMFLKNASKEDLKKIKYYDYFGIRYDNEDKKLYDFDRRVIYHNVEKDPEDDDGLIIDKEDAEPMLDPYKYKYVFIDKHKYIPIQRYYVKDKEAKEENNPEFINKQQNGVESEIILPKTERERESEINTNPIVIRDNPATERSDEEEEEGNSLNESTEIPIREYIERDIEDTERSDEEPHVEPVEPPSDEEEHIDETVEGVTKDNSVIEDLDEGPLSLIPSPNIKDIIIDHVSNVINIDNIPEEDENVMKIILSRDEDALETINPEDISDSMRLTLTNLKQDKIKNEKELNKAEKDLGRTILKYIDKYSGELSAISMSSTDEDYNLEYLINYFNYLCKDEQYKVNKRSIDAVQRRIDKYNYNKVLNKYYNRIPIKQLNRLTKAK